MAGGILALPSLLQLELAALKRGVFVSKGCLESSFDFMVALRLLMGEF